MARTIRSIHAKKARQSVRRPSVATGRNPGDRKPQDEETGPAQACRRHPGQESPLYGQPHSRSDGGPFPARDSRGLDPGGREAAGGHSGWMNASPR